ncbi:MAG: glycosyl hydrolase, partial [Lutimonas sp.]
DYRGSRVGPGTYSLRLSLEGETVEHSVQIMADPNLGNKTEEYTEQQKMLEDLAGMMEDIHNSVNQMRSVRKQLSGYKALLKDNEDAEELLTLGDSLAGRIDSWEKNLIQPDQKTFQDVINFNNHLNAEIMYLRGFIDNADPELTQGARERFKDLKDDWKVYSDERDVIVENEMAGYNAKYKELNLPAIIFEE